MQTHVGVARKLPLFKAARHPFTSRGALVLLAAALLTFPSRAQPKPEDLGQRSIEDLMNYEVTSVSKKEQKMSQVAAAVFVITAEDIRRSGATNIPDLLRMVPGLDVGQINSNTWAVSARGFNHELADKLLVLIDGRSVYTLTFAGVTWDTQDVPLEDIARIEVIRGPGGTLWGANAVNGVINVITKKSADTQGALIATGGGTQERASATAQYGGKIAGDFSYRVFSKYLDRNHSPDLTGGDNSFDNWHLLHGGFRVDGSLSAADSLTFQGDIYSGSEGAEIIHTSIDPPENTNVRTHADLSGGNILGRWSHLSANGSETTLQFYYDRNARYGPESNEIRNTIDFDLQHRLSLGARHDVMWGVGYRLSADHTEGTIDLAYIPSARTVQIFSSFVQDEITLRPGRLFLTVGTKVEHDDFNGYDVDPSVRLAWTPSTRHTLWAAASRASRTPSRLDTAAYIGIAAFPGDDGVPREVILYGNPHQQAEHVIANEVGYRAQLSRRLSVDIASFFNTYDNIRTREFGTPFFQPVPGPARWVIPITWGNKMHGTTQGTEVSADWRVDNRWTLSPGYSLLQMHLHPDAGGQDSSSGPGTEGSNPRHQASLRSHVDLGRSLSWDTGVYFVDSLPAQAIPAYVRVDTRLSWQFGERLEFSLVGQNLLQDHHPESNDIFTIVNPSQVKRGAYAKVTWRF
ncbi:MAG TPA: TonB-dependent receptor [Candidatus Acidoferrales bacterium]|nr:TonB-dependent receptor [Candidatus Acidoferrales bacterium]